MGKNSVKRTSATLQRVDGVGTLSEEHIVIDNSPDKPWLAGIFSTLSLAGIVSAFINGKKE